MNICRSTRESLALRPSDWSADERQQVENHLAICSDCAALARVYAEQDRLIQTAPRLRLTRSQREQLFSRSQRERRRHEMRTIVSAVVGTAAAVVALIALTVGLYALFGESDQLAVETTLPTRQAPVASAISAPPEPPVFADEIHIETLLFELPLGRPITVTLSGQDLAAPPTLGRFYAPADLQLTLTWEFLSPLSAEWRVFLHLMNETGELVSQRDIDVNWSARSCPDDEYGPKCTLTTVHELPFRADLPPGTYTIVTGLYDPITGERAPVTDPAGITPPQVALGEIEVIEPLVFAEEIRIDGYTPDPMTGELVPFTLGERDPEDPLAPGRLQVPSDVQFALNWQVLAPPSVDWRVFVHLVNEGGALVLQSDPAPDWSEPVCAEGEYGKTCTVTTEHEWAFPADLPPGLYTIAVGLYNPETGERAPLTRPAGVALPYTALGRVRIVSDR